MHILLLFISLLLIPSSFQLSYLNMQDSWINAAKGYTVFDIFKLPKAIMKSFIGLIAKTILLISVVFISTKIVLYKHALHKQQRKIYTRTDNETISFDSSEVLDRLNQLTDIPLVGSLFLEPKIEELVRLERYQEGLDLIRSVLDSDNSSRSFKLWLAKAKAELGLQQYELCEESLSRASAYAQSWVDDYRIMLTMEKVTNNKALQQLQARDLAPKRLKSGKVKDYIRQLINSQNQVL